MWSRRIPLQITVLLNTSRRHVNKTSLTWWCALKTLQSHLCKRSGRCLEDVLKTLLLDVFKTFWRSLEDVLARRVEDVTKTPSKHLEDVLKMSWRRTAKMKILILTETSWRRLEDALWRLVTNATILFLLKTSWRRLLKTYD